MMMSNKKNRAVALALLLAASSTEAFVPATNKPQISMASGNPATTPMIAGKTSFVGASMGPRIRASTTSLSMSSGNLLDRFFRVARSNLNKFVASIENPEKVIVQAVEDMQVSCCSTVLYRCWSCAPIVVV